MNINQSKPNILLTNDDGVETKVLYSMKKEFEDIANVWIVAPSFERSTSGHGLTLTRPLQIKEVSERVYSCDGLPADCVLVAIFHLKDIKFDLVLSGINKGANLGSDVYYSGTVAAAREAAFRGIPAIASSLVLDNVKSGQAHNYEYPISFFRRFIENGLFKEIDRNSLLNFNFPNNQNKITKIVRCPPGIRRYSEDIKRYIGPTGNKFYWISGKPLENSSPELNDQLVVERGEVAFTQLNLNHSCQIMETNLDRMISEII